MVPVPPLHSESNEAVGSPVTVGSNDAAGHSNDLSAGKLVNDGGARNGTEIVKVHAVC